jgi:uncharacterized protein (TIGR02001 family)
MLINTLAQVVIIRFKRQTDYLLSRSLSALSLSQRWGGRGFSIPMRLMPVNTKQAGRWRPDTWEVVSVSFPARLAAAVLLCGTTLVIHAIAAFADEGGMEPGGFPPPPRTGAAPFGGIGLTAQAAVLSDYIAHGFTQTAGGVGAQAKGELWGGPFFAGAKVSNVRFGEGFRRHELQLGARGKADAELDAYAGAAPSFRGIEFLLMGMYAYYPNANKPGSDFNFAEFKAGVKGKPVDHLETGFNLYYSPDYFANAGKNWILEGTLGYTLPQMAHITPVISSVLGYQAGDGRHNGFNYWYWNTGLTLTYAQRYKLDLRYHDTAMVPFSCDGQCGSRLAASVKVQF